MDKSIPSVGDLNNGRVRCFQCRAKIELEDYEPLEVVSCLKCGYQMVIPKQVQDFWLYKPLGAGGMGSVYLAVSESDSSRQFAVKILPQNRKNDSELIMSLMREAEIGKALGRHPHIIEVVDYGKGGEEHFLATEFVSGERLDNLLISQEEWVSASMSETTGHLSEKQTINYALQILEALMHISECGYLFRDLKPENVIIDDNGDIRVFDYGLCMTHEEASDTENLPDTFEGSPFYIPPERIVGAAEGEYSEIYSLGMLMYFMLTGRTYYSEAELEELVSKHVDSLRIDTVSSRLPHCTRGTVALLDRMIKRKPNERIPDFSSLDSHMKSVFEEVKNDPHAEEGTFGDDAMIHRAPRQTESDEGLPARKILSSLVLVVCVLILAGIWAFRYLKASEKEKLRQELRVQIASELKIAPDISKPELTLNEIKELIDEKADELLQKKLDELVFNTAAEKQKVAYRLQLNLDALVKPEKTLSDLERDLEKDAKIEIAKEVAKQIKPYDPSAVKKRIAKELHMKLPLSEPAHSFEKLEDNFDNHLSKLVKEKFSTRRLSKQLLATFDKYKPYRIGQKVSITDSGGRPISGKYRGARGGKVIIGTEKVLMGSIPLSQRWRFNKKLSQQKAAKMGSAIKKKFKLEKKNFVGKKKGELQKQYYQDGGYYKGLDRRWKPASKVLDEYLQLDKAKFDAGNKAVAQNIASQIREKIQKSGIYEKNHYRFVSGKWWPEDVAVDKALEIERKKYEARKLTKTAAIRKVARKQAISEVYKANGYIFYNKKWQAARPLLDRLVKGRFMQKYDEES